MADVFVDKVNVGYTHDVLDWALVNKVGVLEGRVSPRNHQVRIFKGSDLLAAAQALEKAGISVFMDKSAKYLIANAGACGFLQVFDLLVPTAGEYIGNISLEDID